MKKTIVALLLLAAASIAAAPADVTTPIHQFIDGFNTGDTKTAYAAYAAGDITIVDEFAPHRWTGPHAPQEWAADYDKHAQATGVTDGSVKYGAPTRTEIEGDAAYVILPTVYNYKEHGQPTTEEGQMTFVLHMESSAWLDHRLDLVRREAPQNQVRAQKIARRMVAIAGEASLDPLKCGLPWLLWTDSRDR